MGDPFDPDGLRIDAPLLVPARRRPPRPAAGGKFLKGPVPMVWLESAFLLPGRALAVGVLLWFEAGLARSDTVHVTYARLAGRGLREGTARRGLRTLESAGLVSIERQAGRALRITILNPPICCAVSDDLCRQLDQWNASVQRHSPVGRPRPEADSFFGDDSLDALRR